LVPHLHPRPALNRTAIFFQGGVTSGITMTAFVVVSLLEADILHYVSKYSFSMKC